MNERDAFIRGIAANLYDDTTRLAFADWLNEHGEHARAEFIHNGEWIFGWDRYGDKRGRIHST